MTKLIIPDPELELLRTENRQLRGLLSEFVEVDRRLLINLNKASKAIVSLLRAMEGTESEAGIDDLMSNNPIYHAKKLLRKAQKRDPI